MLKMVYIRRLNQIKFIMTRITYVLMLLFALCTSISFAQVTATQNFDFTALSGGADGQDQETRTINTGGGAITNFKARITSNDWNYNPHILRVVAPDGTIYNLGAAFDASVIPGPQYDSGVISETGGNWRIDVFELGSATGSLCRVEFEYTFIDNPPTAVCTDFTAQLDAAGNATITAANVDGGSSDAEGAVTLAVSQTAFTCANVGPNTVTLTVTDGSGQTDTCTATVFVEDTMAPTVITQNSTVQLDAAGQVTVLASAVDNGSSDNCGIATVAFGEVGTAFAEVVENQNLTITVPAGTLITSVNFASYGTPTGTNGVYAIGTCHAANSVTVVEGFALGNNTFTVPANNGTFGDPCFGTPKRLFVTVGYSNLNSDITFTCADVGPNVVDLVVIDVNGNSATAPATITVEDSINPAIACPGNITQSNDVGICGAVITWTAPVGTDNCTGATTTSTHNPGDTFPVGTTTVTYTVTDVSGNTDMCSFDVTVNDTEAPMITCTPDITVNNDAGVCGAVVTYADPTVTDNCVLSISTNFIANGDFEAGSFSDWTVMNTGSGNFVINDGTFDPSGPANPQPPMNGSFDIVSNQGGPGLHLISQLVTVPTGVTQANISWLDRIQNFAGGFSDPNQEFRVMLLDAAMAPIQEIFSTNPGDPNIQLGPNARNFDVTALLQTLEGTQVYLSLEERDNLGNFNVSLDDVSFVIDSVGVTLSQTAGLPSGSTFPVGTTTNTFVTTDAVGNTATCSFDVTVVDNELPVANCVAAFTIQLDANGDAAITVADIENGSTDNCGVATTTIDVMDFTCANVGPNDVTLTVTDVNGNVSTCITVVTVEDNVAPVASCVGPFTIQLDANGDASITVTDIDAGSTDACGIATMTIDVMDFTCANVGPNDVTLTVTDVNGNVSTCITVVTVEDNIPPVAVCQNINAFLDANGSVTITAADVDGGSTDACGIASLAIDIDTFTCDTDLGPNDVTLTVTDNNGNVSTCIAVVTVIDNIDPIIACPASQTANTDPGLCSAVVIFPDAIALDNCTVTVAQTGGLTSGDPFPVGVSTIEYTATDSSGNTAVCTFTITVTDNELPVAVCMDITIQLDANGDATITPADIDGGSTDNCGIASLDASQTVFDCSDVGANDITLTVTDVNGNVSTCIAVVTVEDNVDPVAICVSITVELDVNGTVTITPADIDGGSSDACGLASLELDIDTFTCADVGENTVTLTVTDNNGNVTSCTAIVTVEDNIAPDLVCMDITVELDENGEAEIVPEDVMANNTDACGILTTGIDIFQFSCDDIGTPVTVTVFSQDNNGNLSSCMAVVTVVDALAPVVTCPADITVDPGAGNQFYLVPDYYALGEASATDNCTDPLTIFGQDPAAGTLLPDGVYTVTMSATDEYGNVGTCEFELTVESILGVNDNGIDISTIVMYPNPAINVVNISNPQNIELEQAAIYDITGRLVQTYDLKDMGTEKSLDISMLSSATYVVMIQGTEGQVTKQLIKE